MSGRLICRPECFKLCPTVVTVSRAAGVLICEIGLDKYGIVLLSEMRHAIMQARILNVQILDFKHWSLFGQKPVVRFAQNRLVVLCVCVGGVMVGTVVYETEENSRQLKEPWLRH